MCAAMSCGSSAKAVTPEDGPAAPKHRLAETPGGEGKRAGHGHVAI